MHIGIRIDECRDECTLHNKQYYTSKYAFDNFARKQAQHSEDKQRLNYILPHEVAPLNHSDSRRKTCCMPTPSRTYDGIIFIIIYHIEV